MVTGGSHFIHLSFLHPAISQNQTPSKGIAMSQSAYAPLLQNETEELSRELEDQSPVDCESSSSHRVRTRGSIIIAIQVLLNLVFLVVVYIFGSQNRCSRSLDKEVEQLLYCELRALISKESQSTHYIHAVY